jgi:PHD/YefM family antitoxin component YafN of YafNO toxin-antitoxin module
MAIPLTKEQQQAIDSTGATPPEVIDPRTGEAYVLIRAEEYETVREALVEERRQRAIRAVALRNAAGRIQEAP